MEGGATVEDVRSDAGLVALSLAPAIPWADLAARKAATEAARRRGRTRAPAEHGEESRVQRGQGGDNEEAKTRTEAASVEEEEDRAKDEEDEEEENSRLLHWLAASAAIAATEMVGLPAPTAMTAVMYLHRFFLKRSWQEYGGRLETVLATSVFLASKADERPCAMRDIINAVHVLVTGTGSPPRFDGDALYWELKREVVHCEQLLLRILGFDPLVPKPFAFLLNIAHEAGLGAPAVKRAWAVLFTALVEVPPWTHPPHVLACAAVWVAIHMEENRESPAAWEASDYDVSEAQLRRASAVLMNAVERSLVLRPEMLDFSTISGGIESMLKGMRSIATVR